jgi:tRNA (cytidine56-2'-O)-methyltransferase
MKILILRLGHRISRDQRVSTHCGLVSRAFGANGIIYSGEKDQNLLESVRKVSKEWGGKFEVKYEKNWKAFVRNWKGRIAHLTMYGLPVDKVMPKIKKEKNLLVIVGGEKVPPDTYELADFNVSVTNQPHSEIAAIAIFLDRVFKGKELERKFPKARKKIIPQERGKKVIEK